MSDLNALVTDERIPSALLLDKLPSEWIEELRNYFRDAADAEAFLDCESVMLTVREMEGAVCGDDRTEIRKPFTVLLEAVFEATGTDDSVPEQEEDAAVFDAAVSCALRALRALTFAVEWRTVLIDTVSQLADRMGLDNGIVSTIDCERVVECFKEREERTLIEADVKMLRRLLKEGSDVEAFEYVSDLVDSLGDTF